MATLADMRTNLRSHLVIDSTILTDVLCDEFVNTACERMAGAHDWSFQQETSTSITYTSTTNGASLPTDFISATAVYTYDSTASPDSQLTPIDPVPGGRPAWVERQSRPDVSETFPVPSITGVYYYLFDDKIYVVPQPTSTITLQLDYIQSLSDLSGSSSNGFLTKHPRATLWGALYAAYLWQHEWEQAEVVGKMYSDLLTAAIKKDTSYRVSGVAAVRGA